MSDTPNSVEALRRALDDVLIDALPPAALEAIDAALEAGAICRQA